MTRPPPRMEAARIIGSNKRRELTISISLAQYSTDGQLQDTSTQLRSLLLNGHREIGLVPTAISLRIEITLVPYSIFPPSINSSVILALQIIMSTQPSSYPIRSWQEDCYSWFSSKSPLIGWNRIQVGGSASLLSILPSTVQLCTCTILQLDYRFQNPTTTTLPADEISASSFKKWLCGATCMAEICSASPLSPCIIILLTTCFLARNCIKSQQISSLCIDF